MFPICLYQKAARISAILLAVVGFGTAAVQAQDDPTTQLGAQCSAAFRAADYATATSICVQAAEASFTEANEQITNKYIYYFDLLYGADNQETAGEAGFYGHIDSSRSKELIDTAILTLHQIIGSATDAQTLQIANRDLAEATKFEALAFGSGSP